MNQKGDWTVALMFLKLLMTVSVSDRSPGLLCQAHGSEEEEVC